MWIIFFIVILANMVLVFCMVASSILTIYGAKYFNINSIFVDSILGVTTRKMSCSFDVLYKKGAQVVEYKILGFACSWDSIILKKRF